MFIETRRVSSVYTRPSKLGKTHEYTRSRQVAVFRCDNCDRIFDRDLGHMDRRRLNDNYFHVCSHCDAKRFAQKKGVERRRIWSMSVDADIDISKI